MADVINIKDAVAQKKLKYPLSKGWMVKVDLDGVASYELTADGTSLLCKAIEILFWQTKEFKKIEYEHLSTAQALAKYGQSMLDDYENCSLLLLIDMAPEFINMGVEKANDLQYLVDQAYLLKDLD